MSDLSLYFHQIRDLFVREEVIAVLNQPQWTDRYPRFVEEWRSPDKLISSRVLVPGEIVLAIARQCASQGDFHADSDGETLYCAGRGRKPFRLLYDARGAAVGHEQIADAKLISAEEALNGYGADPVWLAAEVGRGRKGERDDRFRIADRRSREPWSQGLPSQRVPPALRRSPRQRQKLLLTSGAVFGLIVAVVAWTNTNQPLWFWATPAFALLSMCLPLLRRVRSNSAPQPDARVPSHAGESSSQPRAAGRER